ncbi:MAG: hypothetical protein Q9M40_00140 [Sulfurimonas sp.]|nr:hypothetical protein [Sulfurimonas sp.]
MVDLKTELLDDKLTQADLIKLMLHNAQHMATREEVKADIDKLDRKIDISFDKLDKKIDKVDSKFDRLQWLIVATIMTVLLKDYILSILAKL